MSRDKVSGLALAFMQEHDKKSPEERKAAWGPDYDAFRCKKRPAWKPALLATRTATSGRRPFASSS